MLVGLFTMSSTNALGEERHRVVCWPAEGATDDAVSAARERLSGLGEVVDLPVSAPDGLTPSARQLQALASANVERAREYYYEAALDEAAELLDDFVERTASLMAESGTFEELRTVLLWLGASLAKAGRHDDAVEPFILAIRLGLDEIDRSLFPPEVTRAFEAARTHIEGAQTATVNFIIRPVGATIEIDGRADFTSVESASERQLAVGRHLVVARRPGYRPVSELVTLGVDAMTIEMNLDPADPELIAEQIALLSREGELDSSDPTHITLLALAMDVDFIDVVGPGTDGEVELYDDAGQPATWPVEPSPTAAASQPPTAEAADDESRPAWRRWWFWVALVGGAAVVATGVGLGVHYGTQNRDTFTLVVRR